MGALSINFSEIELFFHQAGFPVAGAVDYELALPVYHQHAERYARWIQHGSHGEMNYLARGQDRRLDPRLVFPGLQGVIAVLSPYSAKPVGNENLRYARYLRGKDYHLTLQEKLTAAMVQVKAQYPEMEYKVCVDTSAVLERTWAALCGLGWIGKNTLLIHPQFGSYVFIGIVFTNARFDRKPSLHPDYCGSCERCLKTCPTDALPEPHYLEARDCISYLTLEKRGEWQSPTLERSQASVQTAGFLAGCDLCQEVCPFNTKVSKSAGEVSQEGSDRHLLLDAEALLAETEAQYRERVKDTALSRVKYADFRRNLLATQMKS